jgi:hypothetical protein
MRSHLLPVPAIALILFGALTAWHQAAGEKVEGGHGALSDATRGISEARPTAPVATWFAKAPPLPPAHGEAIHVATVDELLAAIDMMALEDWTFSDNVFRDIQGRNGGGRAAVFIWVRSRRVTVERNLIVNCDRGVAFGNPGPSTANVAGERLAYVSGGVIRNNFIAGGADCGIELWHAEGIKVYNNTIWRPDRNWSRGIRVGTGTAHTEVVNNLVHGEIQFDGGEAQLRDNLAGRLEGYFVDPASGDLSLTSAATGAIGRGVPLSEVTDDIRRRPRGGRVDLGAWESDNGKPRPALPVPPGQTH